MAKREPTREELSAKIRNLEERLLEAEQTIEAIRGGEVDAFIVHEPMGEQIYTLKGADHGYRVLVESITEGALILSSDDSIYYCNRTLGEMLRLPIRKIVSTKLDAYVAPECRAKLLELILEGRSCGAVKSEFLMQRNDGTLLPVNVSLNCMSVADFEGVCAVITDLSEQKQVEEELRGHRTKLEFLVNKRTANLQQEISYRKRAEEALRESQGRLSLALEASRAGIWDRNVVENKSIWDDYHHLLFGLAPGTYSGTLKDFFSMIHPDDRERVKSEMTAALDGDSEYSTTYQVVWPDSSVHFLADRGKVHRDSTGRPVRMIGISWDITELKQTEQALKESQQQLANIINFLPDATFVIDREGKVIAWNSAIEEMTGIKAEDMFGKGNYEYAVPFYGERKPILIDLVLKPREEAEARYVSIQRKDSMLAGEAYMPALKGGDRYLFGTASILRDSRGDIVGAIESIQDITERKRAEEALRETTGTLQTLIQASPVAIIVLDPDGSVKLWNPAAERLFGWRETEVLGQFLPYVPDDKREEHRALRERVLRGDSFTGIEVRRRKRDGSPVDISVSTAPMRDAEGHITGIMSVNIDLTEHRRAEEERKTLAERLQRAEKMEALGTLAGGVAHDLNNVLGIVVGYSELLLDDLDESSSARSEAGEILKGGQRAAAIVQDLLTLARRGVPSRKVLNLNNIIVSCQQSPEFAQMFSSNPSIRMKTDFEADLLNISGSAVHLGKSLMNLASNAAEAMSNGGTMTVKTRNQYLDKPISGYDEVKEGDYVVLSVSDTGEGIPAVDLKRVFEPFYTKKVMGRSGTGLGLAVVWGTVKDHHGYINVESEEGKGTTFTLYFPVTREELTPEEVAVSASEYMGNGESILIVDDVKEQRNLGNYDAHEAQLQGIQCFQW